jgi:tyrosinase
MGANEMAGFDPIFYLHHCFIDYVFWEWQKRHGCTLRGSLNIIPGYPGTSSNEGSAAYYPDRDIESGTPLDLNTPLYPWKKADGSWYTSNDLVDIENQLGYSYGPGSLDGISPDGLQFPGRSFLGQPDAADIVLTKRVSGINRAEIEGSFVIRTFVTLKTGERVEIGREPVLSRWQVASCANCKLHLDVESIVPIDETLMSAILGPSYRYVAGDHIDDSKVQYDVEIQTSDEKQKNIPTDLPRVGPLIKSL